MFSSGRCCIHCLQQLIYHVLGPDTALDKVRRCKKSLYPPGACTEPEQVIGQHDYVPVTEAALDFERHFMRQLLIRIPTLVSRKALLLATSPRHSDVVL